MQNLLYEVALSLVEGVGAVTARNLLSYCGSAEAVFNTSESKLLKIPQIGSHLAKAIFQKNTLAEAEKEIALAQKYQIKILSFTNPDYPKRLKRLADAPIILYYRGEADINANKSIAIVGTRQASEYGKNVTEELVKQLQKHQLLIVSGLAYGIDIMAHRACLRHQISTIGVMASGLDVIYPATHKKTALQMMEENGGLMTENRLGTKPDAMRFPARNRIIAGLTDAVIVVEAKAKGGALITANLANDYQKEVFAVPGSVFSSTSEGCHQLIKSHQAHLLTKIEDLESILQWNEQGNFIRKQQALQFENLILTTEEREILGILQNTPEKEMVLDEIAFKSTFSMAQINAFLMNLELAGLIKVLPGKKISLINK